MLLQVGLQASGCQAIHYQKISYEGIVGLRCVCRRVMRERATALWCLHDIKALLRPQP
jgi:hypothetical protein